MIFSIADYDTKTVNSCYAMQQPNKTTGNSSVPIQLARCWFPGLAISDAKKNNYIFQIKYAEAIISNSTQKLLWF